MQSKRSLDYEVTSVSHGITTETLRKVVKTARKKTNFKISLSLWLIRLEENEDIGKSVSALF